MQQQKTERWYKFEKRGERRREIEASLQLNVENSIEILQDTNVL